VTQRTSQVRRTSEVTRLATLEMLRDWHGRRWPEHDGEADDDDGSGGVVASRTDDQLEQLGVSTVSPGSSA